MDWGERLEQQRSELGRMPATGRSDKILPAMHGFIYLCGLDVEMSPEETRWAGAAFLSAVVTSLDHQRARQGGQSLEPTTSRRPPLPPKEPHGGDLPLFTSGLSFVMVEFRRPHGARKLDF